MYKPNGEERMTREEEMRRREIIAERKSERSRSKAEAGSLHSLLFATLSQSSASSEQIVPVGFEALR